jgi:bifunctional DNA-binding transcriptional regulator/antitoxin component of YhaV-PrlF toxin-antitoxin module
MREDLRKCDDVTALWVDKQGRLVLPVTWRRALGLEFGERMKVSALLKGRRVTLVNMMEIAEGMAPWKPKKERKHGKTAKR